MVNKTVVKMLVEKGLKVTPQRIGVLEVILNMNNHPTAETIIDYMRLSYPHIQMGTIYKILDAFSKVGLVNRVKTDNELFRYDAIKKRHHHLYCAESERIEDFYDDDLNKILDEYMKKKKIPNFEVKDIKLQIVGKFTDIKKVK
jgi:Fur family peroxide stress response transcriptional regulator